MTSPGTRDRLVSRLRAEGIKSEIVLNAIMQVPRHQFVDEALASRAYEDTALPIGSSQTISQPWIVARMTEALLDGNTPGKVLEVGTGSGYQATVLSHLIKEVYTVERIKELLKLARRRFHSLRLMNIHARYADGHLGWPTQAPFDGIIVTAASQFIPEDLIEQLVIGGKLIIPIAQNNGQRLLSIVRTEDGQEVSDLGAVIFVPMLSGLD
ncbi:MAG: protein-L-isoaspartate(D-aspartate) O-methyltransferase [Lysobacterales bacterium]|jgi:protein-L-isoaspartate(D-aspartate) O-methyltransferase